MKIKNTLIIMLSMIFITSCASNKNKKLEDETHSNISSKARTNIRSSSLYILSNSQNDCKKDQTTPPDKEFAIGKVDDALDALLSRSADNDAIILYVHGRAAGNLGEPDKSLRTVMPCLEIENKAKVLMFYWPGSGNGGITGFPETEARQAGQALGQVVTEFQKYKETHEEKFKNRKIVLLLHSMGNIVFEEFVDNQFDGIKSNLFDTVILNASASKTQSHANWLKKAKLSSHTYVMVNSSDPVLDKLGIRNTSGRLGKKLDTGWWVFAKPVPLAANAIYVNLDDAGIGKHRYFVISSQNSNNYVKEFFSSVLVGETFELDGFSGVKETGGRDGAKIYYLRE